MFEKLKRRSIQKHTEKNLAGRDRSQVNAALKTLAFLVDEGLHTNFEPFFDLASEMGLQRKDVSVFSFLEVTKKTPSLRSNQVNNKHFSWNGAIRNQDAAEFLDRDFDVLVALYDQNHTFLNHMVSRSKAKFKVGSQGNDDRLFDLTIAVSPKNVATFKIELIKYLKILNKIV
ncbi:MAG: hypothetical protein CMC08_08355 [Flavobacteriaceae bacterium]|nr:hypothetical protein [Flavobacteriaceae bacterium]|tara:strand:+ start:260 stop:778 length:519 start_codon:yes stop_codon:yes gene_type:complete